MIRKFLILWVFTCGYTCASVLKLHVPYEFFPETATQWANVAFMIETTKAKEIDLYWEGIGGMNLIAEDFNNVIDAQRAKGKKIVFIVEGEAVSNHADSVCHSSSYIMRPKGVLIFHPSFDLRLSKLMGHKVYSNDFKLLNYCVDKKFLTSEEESIIVWQHKRLEIDSRGHRVFKPDWTTY
jgi:hypothetical protein